MNGPIGNKRLLTCIHKVCIQILVGIRLYLLIYLMFSSWLNRSDNEYTMENGTIDFNSQVTGLFKGLVDENQRSVEINHFFLQPKLNNEVFRFSF